MACFKNQFCHHIELIFRRKFRWNLLLHMHSEQMPAGGKVNVAEALTRRRQRILQASLLFALCFYY